MTAPLLSESDVDAMEARCGKADRIVDDYYAHEYAVAAALNDIPALIRDRRALKAQCDDLQIRFGAACEHVKIVEGECRTKDETIAALREQLVQTENERDAALETLHEWTEAQAIANRKKMT